MVVTIYQPYIIDLLDPRAEVVLLVLFPVSGNKEFRNPTIKD